MIEIFPIKSQSEQERLSLRCGIEFDKTTKAYQAKSCGETVGLCIFKLNSDENEGKILHLLPCKDKPLDERIATLLCCASINFMLSNGANSISFLPEGFSESFRNFILADV